MIYRFTSWGNFIWPPLGQGPYKKLVNYKACKLKDVCHKILTPYLSRVDTKEIARCFIAQLLQIAAGVSQVRYLIARFFDSSLFLER